MLGDYFVFPDDIDLFTTVIWGIVVTVIGGVIVEGAKGKLTTPRVLFMALISVLAGAIVWAGYYNAPQYMLYFLGTRQEDCADGVAFWQKAIERQPDMGLAYLKIGECLNKYDQHDTAIQWLEAGKEFAPRAQIVHQLGVSYLDNNQPEIAEQNFRTALNLEPDQPNSQFYLALSLHHQVRYADSLTEFEKAVSLAPNAPRERHWLAWSQFENGQCEYAIPNFQYAITGGFETGRSHAGIGFCHLAMSNYGLARSEFEQALATWPDQPDVADALQTLPSP